MSAGKGLRWRAIGAGWAVAAVAGLAISPLLRGVYGAAAPPIERGEFTAGLVVASLTSGFLAYLVGGYVAVRIARRYGGLHGAMTALFGLVVGIALTFPLTALGVVFVDGVAAPPSGFNMGRRALLIGGLLLFLADLFGGYVGGKLGEPSELAARRSD